MGHRWTKDEIADLKELFPTTSASKTAAILNERYGHGRTAAGIYSIVEKMDIQKEGPFWTPERLGFMRDFVPGHSEVEIAAEFEKRFGIRLTRSQVKNGKTRAGVKSGTFGGRFEKGHESWNKGMAWDDYMPLDSQLKIQETQYKKGNMPNNGALRPIGFERVDAEGYTWVKVAWRKSRPGCNDNWRQKHYIEWEKANGMSVPDSCNIVFANHDKSDFSPENLVAVPRSIWSVIVHNGYEYHDASSLQACMNVAKLKTVITGVELSPRACKACGFEFKPRYKHQRRCDACLGRSHHE